MEVSNPRRVLAVALEGSTAHLTRVIRDLTGTNPEQTSTTLAGTTHNLAIKTPYYTAEVPIWLDLIASPEEWAESFLSPEAKEVLEVLGGIMVVFALPPPSSLTLATATSKAIDEASTVQSTPVEKVPSDSTSESEASISPSSITTSPPQPPTAQETRALLQQIGRVVSDGLGGWTWDGVSLCVGIGEADDVDEWEELAAGCGLEFVQVKKTATGSGAGRNEFGEKTGILRILEALESNDWAQEDKDILEDLGIGSDDDDDFGAFTDGGQADGRKKDTDIDPESLDFGFDREDFEGLKRAIWTSGQEVDAFAPPADTKTTTSTTAAGEATSTSSADGADGGGGSQNPSPSGKEITTTTPAAPSRGDNAQALVEITDLEGGDGSAELHLDDAEEVEKIERMMLKLSAVRDMAAGLPEDQRRRMAARAVGEVMREL